MQILNDETNSYTEVNTIFIPNTLPEYKLWKKNQINNSYLSTLKAGFTSNATGNPVEFFYDTIDQTKFMKLALDILAGNAPIPVPIPSKNGIVFHTLEQYKILSKDISNFEWSNQMKLHTLFGMIDASLSISDTELINW